MKHLLNVLALILGLLLYPVTAIIMSNNWTVSFTLSQIFMQILFYSYYLIVSWSYYTILFLFFVGLVIGVITKTSKSEIKATVLYYLILATFAIIFYTVFEGGLTTLTTFDGRLYILAFYILIFKNGIFSLFGAIAIKKIKLPVNRNKKTLQNKSLPKQTICPHCGSAFKSNPIICTYCGGIIDNERYTLLHKDAVNEHLA